MLPKLSIFWSCLYGSKLTLYVGSAVSKLQETLNCQYIKKKKEFVDRWCAWQLWLNGLNGHHGLAEISKEYPCHLLEGEKVIRNERSDVEEKSSAEAQNEAFKRQSLLLSSTDKSTRNTHTQDALCPICSPSGDYRHLQPKISLSQSHQSPWLRLAVHFNKPLRSQWHWDSLAEDLNKLSLSSLIYIFFILFFFNGKCRSAVRSCWSAAL